MVLTLYIDELPDNYVAMCDVEMFWADVFDVEFCLY